MGLFDEYNETDVQRSPVNHEQKVEIHRMRSRNYIRVYFFNNSLFRQDILQDGFR